MIDLNVLDKQCIKCSGLGRIESPERYTLWASRKELKDIFQVLETKEKLIIEETAPDQPSESISAICKECHGRGKILTSEGKRLLEFIRYWMSPNY